jgi:hypothetical protein
VSAPKVVRAAADADANIDFQFVQRTLRHIDPARGTLDLDWTDFVRCTRGQWDRYNVAHMTTFHQLIFYFIKSARKELVAIIARVNMQPGNKSVRSPSKRTRTDRVGTEMRRFEQLIAMCDLYHYPMQTGACVALAMISLYKWCTTFML